MENLLETIRTARFRYMSRWVSEVIPIPIQTAQSNSPSKGDGVVRPLVVLRKVEIRQILISRHHVEPTDQKDGELFIVYWKHARPEAQLQGPFHEFSTSRVL